MTTMTPGTQTPNHHEPAVCPPNPDAECTNCGQALEDHLPLDGPDGTPAADSACPTWLDQSFNLTGGESLDCPDATECLCGVTVCDAHSDEFTTCVDSRHELHHLDCADRCWSCSVEAGRDAAAHMESDR